METQELLQHLGLETDLQELIQLTQLLLQQIPISLTAKYSLTVGVSQQFNKKKILCYCIMSVNIVPVTPNLAIEVKKNEIKDKVIKRLTDLKLADTKYKNSSDILLLICNLTEHLTRDKKLKKKEIVIDIVDTLFILTDEEKLNVSNNIEFLHSNKAIKKLSSFYLFCCSAYEYLFKSRAKKG